MQKEKSLILILSVFKILMVCSPWIFYINFDFHKYCIKILLLSFFTAPLNSVASLTSFWSQPWSQAGQNQIQASPVCSLVTSQASVFSSRKRSNDAQSCSTLCNPMDCNPSGSSIHGILQAKILERVAISSSRGSSRSRGQTCISEVSCIGRQVLHD